jgi:signal recognition particle subunit SRP19
MHDAVVKGLGLEAQLEPRKCYSRDFLNPGRVKVLLKGDDGTPCDSNIPNKQVLLVKCAELCSRHTDRPKRLAELKRFEEQLCSMRAIGGPGGKASASAKASASGTAAVASSSKSSSKGNKKKGKKK